MGINLGSNNLIVNGGFENSNCGLNCAGVYCPNALNANCTINNWTCTGGGQLTYACLYDSANQMVAEGARAAYFGNSYANACSGTASGPFPNNDTLCLTYTGCTVTGIPTGFPLSGSSYGGASGVSLSQTISGLIPGNAYALEFWAGGEYQGWFFKDGMFAVDVGYGNIFLRCKITQQLPDTGTRYIIQFIANATSHTISFTNWGHICGTCTELILDDVRLYSTSHLPDEVVDCLVGMPEMNESSISVYPNPVSDKLYINSGSKEINEVRIFDLLGKAILMFQNNLKEIDIQKLQAGIYFIEIKTQNNIIVKNIFKQ
jgi:hypothetical protein